MHPDDRSDICSVIFVWWFGGALSISMPPPRLPTPPALQAEMNELFGTSPTNESRIADQEEAAEAEAVEPADIVPAVWALAG